MFTIIGYAVVFGAVIGGFVLEGGPVAVLNQTVEFLIIGGAAIGSLLAGTPTKVLAALARTVSKRRSAVAVIRKPTTWNSSTFYTKSSP